MVHPTDDLAADFPDDNSSQRNSKPRHATRVDPAQGADIEQRMAAMTVRRLSKEHECEVSESGECIHPMHRQKVDLAREILSMLGLPGSDPTYTQAEQRLWLRWVGQSGPPEERDAA